jgi:double-stranded uracil-DNA glycosylase
MAPVYRSDATLLILGSLPGEQSLARQQYYANPRNQFWKLVGGIIKADLEGVAYNVRLARLVDSGIALWDVVARADRDGSLDSSLRNISTNELQAFADRLPQLQAIAFNGQAASKAGRQILDSSAGIDLVTLPSSSPAYTMAFMQKQDAWQCLGRYLHHLEP